METPRTTAVTSTAGHHDITLLILVALQALLGLVIYIRRFDIG